MARVLKSTDKAWRDDVLLRLRMRDVPGARIGEVLAEVQSHVAETGEHPREAFGEPKEYADRVADALGAPTGSGWRTVLRGLTWQDVATTVVIGLAATLLADGLWALGAGDTAALGLPAWGVCLVAALALAGCVARVVGTVRDQVDGKQVIDPRTGADMVPFGPWQVAVLAGVPGVMLLGLLIGGLLSR